MERFAAKLLFQYRVKIGKENNKRRICEERIINFEAIDPYDALKKVKSYGKNAEHKYKNDDENWVYYEFVGIMDMIHLGVEVEQEEVWYDIKEYLNPKERKNKLLPKETELNAFKTFNL